MVGLQYYGSLLDVLSLPLPTTNEDTQSPSQEDLHEECGSSCNGGSERVVAAEHDQESA